MFQTSISSERPPVDPARLQPADAEEVHEAAPEAVADAVLGLPVQPRPVVDRHLGHPRPLHPQEGRQEAVHAVEHRDAPQVFGRGIARSVQPTSVTDSWVTRLRMPLAIREETLRTQLSCRLGADAGDHVEARPIRSRRRGMSAGSFWRSASRVTTIPPRAKAEAGVERRRLAAVAPLAQRRARAGPPGPGRASTAGLASVLPSST